jgi:hypothetical protein
MKKILLLLLLAVPFSLEAAGESSLTFQNIALYWAKGVDDNLKEIPGDIVGLDLPTEDTHLYAIGTFLPFWTASGDDSDHLVLGFTAVAAKHSGMQTHMELDGAVTARYNRLLSDESLVNFDIAAGIGLSYAFGTPTYEDPVIADDGTLEYYRFQSYLHFDLELYTPSLESLHLLLRVHHRSGIYGLIAPPKVGSNFVGAGLVYYFD